MSLQHGSWIREVYGRFEIVVNEEAVESLAGARAGAGAVPTYPNRSCIFAVLIGPAVMGLVKAAYFFTTSLFWIGLITAVTTEALEGAVVMDFDTF